MRRRITFATTVLVSQALLLALAIAWMIHMITIAVNGAVYFEEKNPLILWGEVAAIAFITLFAIYVLATQIQRLGERRRGYDKGTDGSD
jgi:ABC-type nickel/cobalt efflux system permease component RcnA